MSKFPKPWLLLACASVLTGCLSSGGGDDEEDTTDGEDDVVPQVQTITTSGSENTTFTQTVDFEITRIAEVRPVSGVTLSFEGSSLTINVGTLENDAIARYQLFAGDDDGATLEISLANTSVLALLSEAEDLAGVTPELIVADDLQLAETVFELEYLAGLKTRSSITSTLEAFQSSLDSADAQLEADLAVLADAVAGYRQGTVTESELGSALLSAQSAIDPIDVVGSELILQVRASLNDMGIALPVDPSSELPVEYVSSASRFSRFQNEAFGSFGAGGQFSFGSGSDFLNAVFDYAQTPSP